jgi:S-adenosylmethionine synthetase
MTGHIRDLTRTMNGQYVISVQVEGDPRELCDKLKDTQIDIEIKKHRQRRSLDANSYAWVLIGKIAEEMHVDRADVYREAIRAIGGTSTIVCVPDKAVETLLDGWKSKGMGWQTETMPSKIKGCTNVVLYYGSSTYDTRQMSLLIDHLVQDAKALGIETMTPRELEAMLGQHHAA